MDRQFLLKSGCGGVGLEGRLTKMERTHDALENGTAPRPNQSVEVCIKKGETTRSKIVMECRAKFNDVLQKIKNGSSVAEKELMAAVMLSADSSVPVCTAKKILSKQHFKNVHLR